MQLTSPRGINLQIVCDASQIFPDDPGQGQPIYIETQDGRYSASWDCGLNTGELSCGDYLLSNDQVKWLDSQEFLVENWKRENHV